MASNEALVVGAGVSGLSSAVLLHDAGFDVSIWAKELTADTTSNVAAAFWEPFLCNPPEKTIKWSKNTYNHLIQTVMHDPTSGVSHTDIATYQTEKTPDPWFRSAIETFARLQPEELPDRYSDGYRMQAILMDTPLYLPWLLRQVNEKGINIEQKELKCFADAPDRYGLVVNCAGLGARELCGDTDLYPVRGQILRVTSVNIPEILQDEADDNFFYIVPRSGDVILGGTVQENDWNLEPDPNDTADILRKVTAFVPELKDAKILEAKVGLRPVRHEVRVEPEIIDGRVVIHNYGHGGAGYTLSWGCAQEVAELARHAAKLDME